MSLVQIQYPGLVMRPRLDYTSATMRFVPVAASMRRMLWRPALLFFALAEAFVAFAPLAEGHFGPSAYAHIEDAGTHLHHAHNEAECAGCAARNLLASADLPALRLPVVVGRADILILASCATLDSVPAVVSRSRGPPQQSA